MTACSFILMTLLFTFSVVLDLISLLGGLSISISSSDMQCIIMNLTRRVSIYVARLKLILQSSLMILYAPRRRAPSGLHVNPG
jgi:hypothetical protein